MSVPFPTNAATPSGGINVPGMLPVEESYIENILRLNKGKLVSIHSTFEHNSEWNAKIFKGLIEAAGRDHVILSDPQTGKRYLIPMIYVDFVTFDEPIDYEYPFGSGPLANYPPR
ncbi:spore coat protein GerQ [Bacillus sp. FSL K6-3431]|uniref:spore coat protein GerQ n=1 Tax=Bacillus sp. FSL K6-3431 TaxID=2921500 RepID=UPI0030F54DF6